VVDCGEAPSGTLRILLHSQCHLIRNTPAAPAAARRYVREALAGQPDCVVDTASLIVSELSTNCVRHAHTDLAVTIEQTESQIRVDIADTGTGVVTPRHPGPAEFSGRGLWIVDQLADAWGVRERGNGDGKSVWFELSLHEKRF
jgi:anti-sigma regulatory factor (Ser/Thr protein kinase)